MKKFFRGVVVIVLTTWLIKEIIFPVSIAVIYSRQFMSQVVECDTAMEASWYYRQQNQIDKPSETIQLLVCHDYDKTRKLMLMSGLPEVYLSWLGLKSLELYQRPAEEYVQQHRFVER